MHRSDLNSSKVTKGNNSDYSVRYLCESHDDGKTLEVGVGSQLRPVSEFVCHDMWSQLQPYGKRSRPKRSCSYVPND